LKSPADNFERGMFFYCKLRPEDRKRVIKYIEHH